MMLASRRECLWWASDAAKQGFHKKKSDSLVWMVQKQNSTRQISRMKKKHGLETPRPRLKTEGYSPFFDSKFFIGDPPLTKLEISHPRPWATGHVLVKDVQTALKNMHTLDSCNFLGFWDIHFENPKILGIICCLFWILGLFILRNRWLPYIRSEISKLLMQKKKATFKTLMTFPFVLLSDW